MKARAAELTQDAEQSSSSEFKALPLGFGGSRSNNLKGIESFGVSNGKDHPRVVFAAERVNLGQVERIP